ncbi:alpha/beta hydrolase [Pseudolysinimonas sp.]|uniref:alpha/beta fold hydrolase n=1 Tax=Pseudolysinimonas sp. TaxID=2680009 RepID=UPI00286A4E79|nr:alpha/beta hydrolase [Pseudolysinimonas sp.]
MFDHYQEVSGEPVDEAERLDRALGDRDWTVPAPGSVASRFRAPSGDLAVVSLGDPTHPRVVLVPGVSGSKEDFVLMLPVLAKAGYFVQSFDLAGQYESGRAGPPRGKRYDYDLFVNDLVAFLDDGGPAHVLGYSFAGTVAKLVLVRRPDLVLSLTLLATPPEPGNGFRGVRGLGPYTFLAGGRIGAALMIWGIRTNKNHVPPQRLEFVRMRFDHTSRRSIEDIIRLMKRAPDVRDQVAATPVPKLVAVGSHDLWPTDLHAEFARRIGARLVVYPTGHSPCETAPHQLARDMIALFEGAG